MATASRPSSSSSSDSSSSDESPDELDNHQSSSRPRRSIGWCAVDTENGTSVPLKWPPDPQSVAQHRWRNLKPVHFNPQPKFGNMMQLFSGTSYNVGVYYDGVRGTRDDSDIHTHLELISAGPVGHVRILGMLTKHYIAMDNKGRLYAEPNYAEESTIFKESFYRGKRNVDYNVYLSKKHEKKGWYLAIKKNGKFKRGPRTRIKQKAAHFLPRRRKFQ